jgi:hypothetical protein
MNHPLLSEGGTVQLHVDNMARFSTAIWRGSTITVIGRGILHEMRTAQQTLSDFAALSMRAEAAAAGESDVAVLLASLSSA